MLFCTGKSKCRSLWMFPCYVRYEKRRGVVANPLGVVTPLSYNSNSCAVNNQLWKLLIFNVYRI